MARHLLVFFAASAWFALAGCGDDPVLKDGGRSLEGSGSSSSSGSASPSLSAGPDRGDGDSEKPPEKVPPPLPELKPPLDEYYKTAVDFSELHLSKRQPGVVLDPLMLVFASGGPGADRFYRGEEQTPFTGWIKDLNENGTLGELTRFVNGLEDGVSYTWHDNGQRESLAFYSEGQYIGEWIFWDREGNETKRETFENGVRVTP